MITVGRPRRPRRSGRAGRAGAVRRSTSLRPVHRATAPGPVPAGRRGPPLADVWSPRHGRHHWRGAQRADGSWCIRSGSQNTSPTRLPGTPEGSMLAVAAAVPPIRVARSDRSAPTRLEANIVSWCVFIARRHRCAPPGTRDRRVADLRPAYVGRERPGRADWSPAHPTVGTVQTCSRSAARCCSGDPTVATRVSQGSSRAVTTARPPTATGRSDW